MLDLYGLTQKYFGDQGSEVVDMMYNIALAESGGNPNAYNGVGLDNSHGLWQINVHPQANPDLAGMNLNDPEQNAQAARIIYDRQGPQAWSTYGTVIARGTGGGGRGVTNALDPNLIVDEIWQSRPDPNDPKYKNADPTDPNAPDYDLDLIEWRGLLADTMAYAESKQEEAAGIFRMEDGMIITRDQMDALDPTSRAQVESYIANKNIERENAFNQVLNELDLTEFQVGQQSAGMENQRRSQDFQNKLESIREGINFDVLNQDTAVKKVNRQLDGMAESRSRATEAMNELMAAAPWGTSNGKTSFSANDLGAGVAGLARLGNLNPSDPLINFTGTQTVDPNAMFNFYDQQLGVTGQLPGIPDLDPSWAGRIPQAPGSIPIQRGSPTFRRPQAPAQTPMPQSTPLPPLPEIALPMLRSILGMYGGWR